MTKYHKLKIGDRVMRIDKYSKENLYGYVKEIQKVILSKKVGKEIKITRKLTYLVELVYKQDYKQTYWLPRREIAHLNDEEFLVESI